METTRPGKTELGESTETGRAMNWRSWTWKDIDFPRDSATKLQDRFEMGFFESVLASEPDQLDALLALGNLYSKYRLHEKGLEVDKRLVRMHPREPLYYYNLACSHSLLGQIDTAFDALTQALQLGYDKFEQLKADPDLENLKKDCRYESLLKEHHPTPERENG
jgi:tetratricopeptide (TPR) repeat protein